MTAEIAVLDIWTLIVDWVFGGFWLAVFGLGAVLFIIMGFLGRMSVYSTMWICIMFLLAMTLGYGYVLINMLITIILIVYTFLAIQRAITN